MNEPRRLLDEGGSDLELSILRAGRADTPSPTSRRKALVALGLAGSATVTTATSTATAAWVKSAGTVALLKWIGVGVIGGLVTIGVVAVRSPSSAAPPLPHGRAASGPGPRPPAELLAAPIPDPVSTGAPVPPAPAPSGADAVVSPPTAASSPADPRPRASARPPATTLTEEIAALDAASEALGAGDASRALRALDDHDRRFAGGMLGPEAVVLRIDALVLRGDRASAARLGEAFLAAHPRSPHASHIRSSIGAPAPAAP